MLALVGEVMGALDLEEFSQALLSSLRSAVGADWCALNELPADWPDAVSKTEPPVDTKFHVAFARFGHQNPLVEHYARTRDSRATRFSDVISQPELRQLDLYRELYQPLGVEFQIAFMLPSGKERILGVALSRGAADFTDRERDLLNLARPYLIQAYHNALAYTRLQRETQSPTSTAADLRALGLTARQAEIVGLIARGHSDETAAQTMKVGIRTAHKHLQLAYRILGVHSRTEAAQIVWSLTTDHLPNRSSSATVPPAAEKWPRGHEF